MMIVIIIIIIIIGNNNRISTAHYVRNFLLVPLVNGLAAKENVFLTAELEMSPAKFRNACTFSSIS